ncbi:UNVERIFIED_CONTAM: hypothetical protein K2H54_050990 [Gekko kuhli]
MAPNGAAGTRSRRDQSASMLWKTLKLNVSIGSSGRLHHHVRDHSDHLFQVPVELLLDPLKLVQSLSHLIFLLILFSKKIFLMLFQAVCYPGLTSIRPTSYAWSQSLAAQSLGHSHIEQALPSWLLIQQIGLLR